MASLACVTGLPEKPPPIVEFSVQDMFNLPLFESFLVLDVRPKEQYIRCHAAGAWHVEHYDDHVSVCKLLARIGDEDPPEQRNTIVICRNETQATETIVSCLAHAADTDNDGSFGNRLMRSVQRMGIFSDVNALGAAYPYLTTTGDSERGYAPLLPALVMPADVATGRGALYLGSQAHASDADAFERLGIKAVVNATSEVPSYFDGNGPVYHRCRVEDNIMQDLGDAFDTSCEFIRTVGCGAGVPTLVHCSRGRNRSAALAACYLIRACKVNPDDAIAMLRRCRPGGTLSNGGFVQQLKAL